MNSPIPAPKATFLTATEIARELRISTPALAKKLKLVTPDAVLRYGQRQLPLYRDGRFTSVPTGNV